MCTEDDGKMLPITSLSRPPFAGELLRGLAEYGRHKSATSWARVSSFAEEAIVYSRKYPFNPAEIKEELQQSIIIENKRLREGLEPVYRHPPFAHHDVWRSFYWNRIPILIQQYRAFDEEDFQTALAPGLKEWISDVLVYFDAHPELNFDMFRDVSQAKDIRRKTRAKMEALQKMLKAEPSFVLDEQSKDLIARGPPIVFITHKTDPDDFPSTIDVLFARPMELGKDIPWIATSDVEFVKNYLAMAKLSKKVEVVSFDALRALQRG